MMTSHRERVVCIGLVCIDLVSVCKEFPKEDTDQRVNSLHWQRGGNASNSSIVLSLLGTHVDFVGAVPISTDSNNTSLGITAAKHVVDDMKKHGVGVDHIVTILCEDFPTSIVMVNAQNGSRTIMHFRGSMPELSLDNMLCFDLNHFGWIHFEARPNINEIGKAIKQIRENAKEVTISLELEKISVYNADPTLQCARHANVVFVSKEFASNMGCKSAIEAAEHLHTLLPGVTVICPWGSAGAAYFEGGTSQLVEAKPVIDVVDTLGAGDTFIAGVIHAMNKGRTVAESVRFGCRVAERKISDHGFSHISGLSVES